MPSAGLLTKERAAEAVELVRPTIMAGMNSGRFKRWGLHIVVMDPTVKPGQDGEPILYEESFSKESWELDYREIARRKASISWRTGLPTQLVREMAPHLLIVEPKLGYSDVALYGSAVVYGIVVGVSGVQPYFDQMIAGMIAEVCRALCIEVMQEEILPSGKIVLSEVPLLQP